MVKMAKGTHDHEIDPRNTEILININGELFPRDEAKISVFDSGFILGDGVWEGLRLHNGKLQLIDQHLQRLYEGAKALDMDIGLSREALTERVIETCRANNARVLLAGMKALPNYGKEYNQEFEAVFPRLAEKHHLPLIPFFLKNVAGIQTRTRPDGIHPLAEVY